MASVLQIVPITELKNQERVPRVFSKIGFNVSQAGTGFLRPDEFLRQCFAIVLLADCFLSAFTVLKNS